MPRGHAKSLWGDLSSLKKWIIGTAAVVVATTTLLTTFGIKIEFPFYLRYEGDALATAVGQHAVSLNYLLNRAYWNDRQKLCSQAQADVARLAVNELDNAASSNLEMIRHNIAWYNQWFHYPPPAATGLPC